jgi:sirohydrochlorin cobaltochelatase
MGDGRWAMGDGRWAMGDVNQGSLVVAHSRQLARRQALGYESDVMFEYADDGLILLGHGTTLNAESAAPVYLHAAELRGHRGFKEVKEAFLKQPPELLSVLEGMTTRRVFVVPFFISEGYFSESVVPGMLGFEGESRVGTVLGRSVVYCRPVGTHPAMTEVLLDRARQTVARFPFPRTPREKDITLYIAGHGTGRSAESRKSVETQVERIRAQGLYGAVEAVFMEEEPKILGCVERAATKNVVVVPFFISDGLHVREDIPVLLGESKAVVERRLAQGQSVWRNPSEKAGKRVWYTAAVGTDPLMTRVILERVREAMLW